MLIPRFCQFHMHKTARARLAKLLAIGLFLLLAGCSGDDEGLVAKNIPQNIVVNTGARAVELSWSGVVGASGYTVYWSNQPGVTPRNGYPVATAEPTLKHLSLSNDMTYYYVITSTRISGESKASAEVRAMPEAAPPAAPQEVVAKAENGRVRLSWNAVPGASRYTVYWSNDMGVSGDDTRIDNVVTPFVHSELQNGQTYHYIVVAENDRGRGAASLPVQAQPQQPIPTAPVVTEALVNTNSVELHWTDASAGNDSTTVYDLYWNTTGNVANSDAIIIGVTSPYRHAPLNNGENYYYRVQARNNAGRSELSNSVHVQPPGTGDVSAVGTLAATPDANNIEIDIEDGQLSFAWAEIAGAVAYNLYWTDMATGAVTLADNKITNIQSPYTHIQLNNGTRYRYAISALNNNGESELSTEFSGTPQLVIPGVPAGVNASGGDEWIAARWLEVENALSYTVYVTDVETSIEQEIVQATSPLRIDASRLNTALVNGRRYRVEVVAVNERSASVRSVAVEAIPQEPPSNAPSQLTAQPGNSEVVLNWRPAQAQNPADPDESVLGYRVYYSLQAGVTPLNGNLIPAQNGAGQANYRQVMDEQNNPVWELQHTGLSNGQRYYYVVTALNAGGESRPSDQIWAKPQVPIPSMPSNIWAEAGDNQAVLHFNEAVEGDVVSYNLYWNKAVAGETSTGRSATQVITNILPNYVFQDGANNNGNTFYFRFTTVNAGGESELSAEVSASPQIPPPESAPQSVSIIAQQSQVTLNWAPVANADGYAVYWSTEANIDAALSARISGSSVQPGYVHTGLLNGQVYYYKLAAVNAGGESALSEMVVAMPQWNPPSTPTNVVVLASNSEVFVNWPLVETASSYTLYWHTDPINNDPLINWSSQLAVKSGTSVTGLNNGQLYHFRLQAHNAGGGSPVSDTVSVMPQQTAPASPGGLSIASADGQLSLNWTTRPNESYTLYWTSDTNPAVSPVASGNKITNVRPTYVHQEVSSGVSLSNGTAYRYQLTASNSGGESPPTTEVVATPTVAALTTPQALRAQSENEKIILSWLPPSSGNGPYRYTVYWSNVAGQGTNGTAIGNINSAGYIHNALSNGQTYHYVVTATGNSGESEMSLAVSATPQSRAPGQVVGVWTEPSDGQNVVRWQAVADATQYLVEWSLQRDLATNVLQGDIQSMPVLSPTLQFVHTGLTNGEAVYYRVSAQNNNGVGGALLSGPVSTTVTGTPQGSGGAPTDITLSNNSIAENSANTTIVGTLNAVDAAGDTHSYRFIAPNSNAGGRFSIVGNQLQVANSALLDYETASSHVITVQAEDQGALVFSRDLTINLTDVNDEAPVITNTMLTPSIPENSTVVVTLAVSDADTVNGSLVYTLTGADAAQFEMADSTLQFKATAVPDYEAPADVGLDNVYNLSVAVNDGVNTSIVKDFVVTVTNVLDVLNATNLNTSEAFVENSAAFTLAPIVVTSPDTTPVTITFVPSDTAAGSLLIQSSPNVATNFDATTGVMSATGLAADLNSVLANVTFTPASGYTSGFFYTVTVSDGVRPNLSGNKLFAVTPLTEAIAASVVSITPASPILVGDTVNIVVSVRDAATNPLSATVTINVTGANPQTLTVVNPSQGRYTAGYVAANAGSDSLAVLINGAPITTPVLIIEPVSLVAPVANVGTNQSVSKNTIVGLDGRGSTDGDGNSLSYAWIQTSGEAVTLVDANTATPTFTTPTTGGALTFELTASDYASQGKATTTVVVKESVEQSPFRRSISFSAADATNDIEIVGNRAYVADGNAGLQIVDITNPLNPIIISPSGTSVGAKDVAIAGNFAYVLANYSNIVHAIDVTDPANPGAAIQIPVSNISTARSVAVYNNYLYVAGRNGVAMININDLNNPVPITIISPWGSESWDVTFSGNFAYIASNSGLQIVDISDPANPGAPVNKKQVRNYGVGVAVSGNYAYIADDVAGFTIIDISDPTTVSPPEELSYNLRTNYWARDVVVVGNTAYVTIQVSGLVIIDITDPTNPVITQSIDTPGTGTNLDVAGNYAYIADGKHGLAIIDISNTPQRVEPVQANGISRALDVEVVGNYAYVVDYTLGYLRIVDITDPNNPAAPVSVSVQNSSVDVQIVNNFAYVTGSSGFSIIDISTPTTPGVPATVSAVGTSVRKMAVANTTAFFFDNTGFYSVDVTNPSVPGTPQLVNITASISDFAVAGNTLYIIGSSLLRVFDVTDLANITELGNISLTDPASKIAVFGNYAYITNNLDTLTIVDVSNSSLPGPIKKVSVAGDNVSVSGNYAYLSARSGGLNVVDISDQANPVWVGNYTTLTSAYGASVSGNKAYIADYFGKLTIVDIQQQFDFSVSNPIPVTGGEQYTLNWSIPVGATDTNLHCLVDIGSCTFNTVDQILKQATVTWTLPNTMPPGEYGINFYSGNWHYFNGIRRTVSR